MTPETNAAYLINSVKDAVAKRQMGNAHQYLDVLVTMPLTAAQAESAKALAVEAHYAGVMNLGTAVAA